MRARVGKNEKLGKMAVRLPEDLHKYLSLSARLNDRSLNYEIMLRLRASIELDRILKIDTSEEILTRVAQLRRRMVDLRLPEDKA